MISSQKTRRFFWCALLLIAGCGPIPDLQNSSSSQHDINQDDPQFQKLGYRNADGGLLPVRLFVPESYTAAKKYPLVLYLHDSSGAGNDDVQQIIGGNYPGTHVWATPENQAQYPCFVMVPQCGEGRTWADTDYGQLTPELKNVLGALAEIENQYSIDVDRLYIVGVSMGAYGVWDFIEKDPTRFAAAVPIAGAGDPNSAEEIAALPIWMFHGAADRTVSVELARELAEIVEESDGALRYTEYPNGGHDIATQVFAEPNLLSWVFAQKRTHLP